jgi:hypothetical protein
LVITLICTTSRPILASASTNLGLDKGVFILL